jgi:methylated-DNA-[protein]-cysteine S-methyltransferase
VSGLAYSAIETPVGRLLAAAGERGLLRIGLPNEEPGEVLAELTGRLGTQPVESPQMLAEVRRQLDEYFAGERREFAVPLDLSLRSGFDRRACESMTHIRYGETVSYAELAARAGNPRAARAAGHACATNPIAIVVPCHRVVGSDGSLHGYGGGLPMKRFLLQLEGALLDV